MLPPNSFVVALVGRGPTVCSWCILMAFFFRGKSVPVYTFWAVTCEFTIRRQEVHPRNTVLLHTFPLTHMGEFIVLVSYLSPKEGPVGMFTPH